MRKNRRKISQTDEKMKNFVTFEGCDGVGKTYQINKLREYCKQQNFTDVVFTREPGGSSIAEQIRNIILDAKNKEMDDLCEAFLYASARIQHLHDIVRPALAEGKVVFCDRFVHSSYCYQGLGRGLGYDRVVALNKLAVGDCMPEFTVFLDLSPEKAFERKGGADKTDRLEMVNLDFHKRVYQGYLDVIAENPSAFEVIDASGSPEETQSLIRQALVRRGVLPC